MQTLAYMYTIGKNNLKNTVKIKSSITIWLKLNY